MSSYIKRSITSLFSSLDVDSIFNLLKNIYIHSEYRWRKIILSYHQQYWIPAENQTINWRWVVVYKTHQQSSSNELEVFLFYFLSFFFFRNLKTLNRWWLKFGTICSFKELMNSNTYVFSSRPSKSLAFPLFSLFLSLVKMMWPFH